MRYLTRFILVLQAYLWLAFFRATLALEIPRDNESFLALVILTAIFAIAEWIVFGTIVGIWAYIRRGDPWKYLIGPSTSVLFLLAACGDIRSVAPVVIATYCGGWLLGWLSLAIIERYCSFSQTRT